MFLQLQCVSLTILVSFLLNASVDAQNFQISPTADDENRMIKEVFAAATKALGKPDDLAKIKSIRALAECSGPKGEYLTEVVSWRGVRTYFEQKFPADNLTNKTWIEGKFAWGFDSTQIAVPLSDFSVFVTQMHEFQKLAISFSSLLKEFKWRGEEEFGGRQCFKIESTHAKGGQVYLFFDQEEKRLVGFVIPVEGDAQDVVNIFKEWQTIDGVTVPSVIQATDQNGIWTLDFTKISFNAETEDDPFEIPGRITSIAEVKRLHKRQRQAHLSYDAEMLVDLLSDPCTEIQRGNSVRRSREDNLKRFRNYFRNVKFKAWDDIQPPVIRMSRDGTLATLIAQKKVVAYSRSDIEKKADETVFAWTETWEKLDGRWKITVITSTRQPANAQRSVKKSKQKNE